MHNSKVQAILFCLIVAVGMSLALNGRLEARSIPADTAERLRSDWLAFRKQYGEAMEKCRLARNAYCEPYYQWLEARKAENTDQLFEEYQNLHGPVPEDITSEWLPEFEKRLRNCRDEAVRADMINTLLMIYSNEWRKDDLLALYCGYVDQHSDEPLVGRHADSVLFAARSNGDDTWAVELLKGAAARSTNGSNRRVIRLALARRLVRDCMTEEATTALQQIVDEHHGTHEAKMAAGELYELQRLAVGMTAPEFSVKDINGAPLSLAELRGRPVVLVFWATWCGPCKGEIPALKEIQEKYSADGLQVIGVSLDEDSEVLKKFLKQKGMTWPQICDHKVWNGELAQAYHAWAIPKTFLIDREGRIVSKDMMANDLLVQRVGELVTGKEPATASGKPVSIEKR